jgi:hypothetical protein
MIAHSRGFVKPHSLSERLFFYPQSYLSSSRKGGYQLLDTQSISWYNKPKKGADDLSSISKRILPNSNSYPALKRVAKRKPAGGKKNTTKTPLLLPARIKASDWE